MVKKKSIYPYLLVAPALIIILCVVFIPVINAIGMSFQSYDLRRPNDIAFVGLANYIAAQMCIRDSVHSGENELVIMVQDLSDTSYHAKGKQKLKRGGMYYTCLLYTSNVIQTANMNEQSEM